jgi:hypothetical protein
VIMITIAVRTRAQTEPQSEVASSSSTTTGAATGHERAVKGPPNTRRAAVRRQRPAAPHSASRTHCRAAWEGAPRREAGGARRSDQIRRRPNQSKTKQSEGAARPGQC